MRMTCAAAQFQPTMSAPIPTSRPPVTRFIARIRAGRCIERLSRCENIAIDATPPANSSANVAASSRYWRFRLHSAFALMNCGKNDGKNSSVFGFRPEVATPRQNSSRPVPDSDCAISDDAAGVWAGARLSHYLQPSQTR